MNIRSISFAGLLLLAAWRAEAGATPSPLEARANDIAFRVCVVDEARAQDVSAERVALRARVVACFQQTLGAGWRELNDEQVKTAVAATRMKAGECDAVIFFGKKRPRKLRRLEVVTFAVDLGPARGYEPVYLIVPARELQLQQKILADFPKALAPLHPSNVMLAAR